MQKQKTISQLLLPVALVTVAILMVPFVAMQFTDEVNWSISDFIGMGVLLFGTTLSFGVVIQSSVSIIYRVAMSMAIGTTFLMIWANLAVGLIGSGPNLGNLLYIGVVALVIISSIRSIFTPEGMERAMNVTAIAIVIVAAIELLAEMDAYPGSSVKEIIGVNGFFAALFAIAGSLFHLAAKQQSPQKSES